MAYTSKYKQAEIEAILDAKNNTGAGVDATLDGLFVDSLQTKEVELSESAEITPDEGYLGLKKVNVSVKGGGGTELEGEYYLAKPNGRYWKSKLSHMMRNRYPVIDTYHGSDFTDEQLGILSTYCILFSYFGYTATYDYGGSPSSGSQVLLVTPTDVSKKAGENERDLYLYKQGKVDGFSLMGAWQECSINGDALGIDGMVNLVDFMRILMEGEADNMSDDEVLALASEMLMIEPVTKEEYESYYNW